MIDRSESNIIKVHVSLHNKFAKVVRNVNAQRLLTFCDAAGKLFTRRCFEVAQNVSISSIHVEVEICFPAIEQIRLINFQSEELGARSQEAAA